MIYPAGQISCLYRKAGETYPENTVTLTPLGTFHIDIEQFLGQAGADSVVVLEKNDIKSYYYSFIRLHEKSNRDYVDYTKPKVRAYYSTFICPLTLGKGVVKETKNSRRSLTPVMTFIASIFTYITSYFIVRDVLTISNSKKILRRVVNIKHLLLEARRENPKISQDPIYKSIEKVVLERAKIYRRNFVSAIFNIALITAAVASAVLVIIGACVPVPPLMVAGTIIVGTIIVSKAIKAIAEANSRLDRPSFEAILEQTEILRMETPPYDEKMKRIDTLAHQAQAIAYAQSLYRKNITESLEEQYERLQKEELLRQEYGEDLSYHEDKTKREFQTLQPSSPPTFSRMNPML